MKPSPACLAMVAEEEGTVLHVYDDHDSSRLTYVPALGRYQRADGSPPIGYATIGVGHLIRPGEVFGDITIDRAHEILAGDIGDVVAALNRQVPDGTPGWNQNRFDALCDFGVNCGQMAVTKYHLLEPILANDWPSVEAPLKAIDKSKGAVLPVLVRRRAREWDLCCKPMPGEEIDSSDVLESVRETSLDATSDFRGGSPVPDDDVPPTDRNS